MQRIAQCILDKKLGACVQIDTICSLYAWEGKRMDEDEKRLMIKTSKALISSLEKTIKEVRSDSIPEVIFSPIGHASKEYSAWID